MRRIAGTEEQPRIWLWLTAFAVIVAGMTLVAKVLDVDELDTPSYGTPGFARIDSPRPPPLLDKAVPASTKPTAVAGDYAERAPSHGAVPFEPIASEALAGHNIALSPVRVTRVIGSRSFFVRPARATAPTREILVVLSDDEAAASPSPVEPDMRLAVRGTLRELDDVTPQALKRSSGISHRRQYHPRVSFTQ